MDVIPLIQTIDHFFHSAFAQRSERQALLDFVEQDSCAALVTVTESFIHLDDGWHYTSADYLTLGRQFAERVAQLESQCSPD